MANDLVTVIVPTFNRANLLPRAIRSVKAQTYPHWELVIVDDGSTDGTVHTVVKESLGDSRIIYMHKDHGGPAESRNAGMRAARGAYYAFLDSDDEYLPAHIEQRLLYLEEHPAADFLHGGVHVLGGLDRRFVPDKNDPSALVPLSECVIGGTFFCRAGIIEAAGGWRPGYAEDADLFERVSKHSSVHEVPFETYIYHRDSPDSRVDDAALP